MNDVRMFSQGMGLLQCVFKGRCEVKPMNHRRLGDIGQQAHSVQRGQALSIECQGISDAQAVGN